MWKHHQELVSVDDSRVVALLEKYYFVQAVCTNLN